MNKLLQVILVTACFCLALNLLTGSAVRAQSTTVTLDAPAQVAEGSDFVARVNIANVSNLDATNYDVSYDSNILEVGNVTNGLINGTTIPVDMWRVITPGTIRVVQSIPGLSGVSGSGYLAEIHFHVIGSAGNTSNISLSNGILSDISAHQISATWIGDSILVSTVLHADFSASPTQGIAGGTQFAFTDASGGGTPPYTYQWDFDNNGTWDSTAQNPTYAYSAPGNYTVTLKVTDAAGNTNTKTKTGYIAVYAALQADFTGNRTAVVVGQSVQFSNGSTGGVAPLSYQWDFDNNGTWDSTAQNPTYAYSAAGNYTVTLKVTDAAGNTNTKTKTGYVAVYAALQADFTGNRTAVVVGQSVQFSNGSTGGVAPLSYQWDFDNNGAWDSTAQNPTYAYSAAGNYTVTLKVTDAAGNANTKTKTGYIAVYKRGDANQDGNVNSLDITKVEREIIALDAQTPAADANGDAKIDALDITSIELIIMGS
jgi:PKD repeat protein